MRALATLQLSRGPSSPWLRFGSLTALLIGIALLSITLLVDVNHSQLVTAIVPALLISLGSAICLTTYALRHLWTHHEIADRNFCATACESTSIFENVPDGILILDKEANCLEGNPAAASILQIPRNGLVGKNIRNFFADCQTFAQQWNSFLQNRTQRGRAELLAADGNTVFVDFTAVANYLPERHIFILCDVTDRTRDISSRKQAERQIAEHLDAAEAARAEAEALRKATLALSQNLAMDSVLDTLLECIAELVPFDCASVLFVQEGADLMVAREVLRGQPKRVGLVLSPTQSVFLQTILFERKAVLISDTARELEWKDVPPLDCARSWLGIPLTGAGH